MKLVKIKNTAYWYLFLLITLSLITRIIPAVGSPVIADTNAWWTFGVGLLHGLNPYTNFIDHPRFPPTWILVGASPAAWISTTLHIPFGILVKTPVIIADTMISLLLFHLSPARNINHKFYTGLLYAVNPISILVVGFHGQFDTIPILMTLLSIMFLQQKKLHLAGLVFGIGVAFKSFPLLVLPLLFIYYLKRYSLKEKMLFFLWCGAPTFLVLLPFMMMNFQSVMTNVFAYPGSPDHGWAAPIRGLYWLLHNAIYIPVPFMNVILQISKFLFLLAYCLFLRYYAGKRGRSIFLDVATVFCLFYFLFAGIASQYLLWSLPFSILWSMKHSVYYSLGALLSMIGYYVFFLPRLLLWAVPFISISSNVEQTVRNTVFHSGNVFSLGVMSIYIKVALIGHLIVASIFWVFIGWFLFKRLLSSRQTV